MCNVQKLVNDRQEEADKLVSNLTDHRLSG